MVKNKSAEISFVKKFHISVLIMLLSVAGWAVSPFGLLGTVQAANLTSVSDTLSTSAPSTASNHTISFVTPTGVSAGQTITITFPAGFNMNSIDFADVDLSVASTDQALAAAPSGATWGVGLSGQVLTITSGTATVAPAATVVIEIGTHATFGATGNTQITNPTVGSYTISIAGTMTDRGNTMVAIVSTVTMTATVDSTFTFTISGVATGQSNANGEAGTTSVTTTSTAIPWGTLSPGVAKTARQDLAVSTNATNGFVVTVQQNQNLLSSTGADIDAFKDGAYTATPTAWTSPLSTLGNESTYGHYGITSEDADLNSDEFGTALYAGNLNVPRQVFSHTAPADGTTTNIGATRVGYKIQIGVLQEAGSDYTNTLTYVATPTF